MKFNYINSTGEEAYYEITLLTNELYKNILETDKTFLEEVAQKKHFQKEEIFKAAEEMLQNYGKGKDSSLSKSKDENVIVGVVTVKKVLKESLEPTKKKGDTPKSILRKHLSSNQIRMFKKDKMTSVLDQ